MVGEVFEHVCTETKDGQLVQCGDASKKLHDEDLVAKRKAGVKVLQYVVEIFAKRLGVLR